MKSKNRVISSKDYDNAVTRMGNIAPPVGSRNFNPVPNRNLSPEQFHAAKSFEQQRLL